MSDNPAVILRVILERLVPVELRSDDWDEDFALLERWLEEVIPEE